MPNDRSLAARFARFAAEECAGYSPLYERLAAGVAGDAGLLALAAHAGPGQPPPNLLLGAVHYLLLRDADDPLAAFYPSLARDPAPAGEAYPAFRAFCLARGDEIAALLATRRVQTNEVGRSAYLYPAFGWIARLAGRPLALVEIGASAGLNLNWHRYGYRYAGDGRTYGDPGSPVVVESEWRGPLRPSLPPWAPPVASAVGVDLHPLNPTDADQALWLRALVWPEHRRRAALLAGALGLARSHPPRVVAGDGVDRVAGLVHEAPAGAAPCVFHTHALYQFTDDRARLAATLAGIGARRDLYYLSVEEDGTGPARAQLTAWKGGQRSEALLARCHGHGRWIEWLTPSVPPPSPPAAPASAAPG
jgi:hypothetical protein